MSMAITKASLNETLQPTYLPLGHFRGNPASNHKPMQVVNTTILEIA